MPVPTVSFVAPDVLAITYEVGKKLSDGAITTYTAKAGDIVDDARQVYRNGNAIGLLVGKDNTKIHLNDTYLADPAQSLFNGQNGAAFIDKEQSYRITIGGQTYAPDAVFRKSTILESAKVDDGIASFVVQHTIHLKLVAPPAVGQQIKVDFQSPLLTDLDFRFDPATTRSNAVHVTHGGFDADDPLKIAFLSTWLGENPGVEGETQYVEYAVGTKFHVINSETGTKVYTGQIKLGQAANNPSNFSENYSGAPVYQMDFSTVKQQGNYHVFVEGVGKSYDFSIGEHTWEDSFVLSARGLFHQRSGIEIGAPYTDWNKPRDFHPDDGVVILQSTATIMDTLMGLNLKNEDSFTALVAGATNQKVNVSGGWHDAADWDRRIQHLEAVNDLLLLAEVKPDFVESVKLNIPESANNIPDVIDEALWGLDFFMRLQRADGGVSGGIESAEHPKAGEASWTESLPVYAYAPDAWSSYKFAASAAKAAGVIREFDSARADGYLAAARKAMTWAEANTPGYAKTEIELVKERNLAAAELYKATGEAKYNAIYLASTLYGKDNTLQWNEHMVEAAYVYSTTTHAGVNKTIQDLGEADILGEAQFWLNWSKDDGFLNTVNPWAPVTFNGLLTNPEYASTHFTRAHLLTGDVKWHEAMIGATQFTQGANPMNMPFTTGLGSNSPREIQDTDSDGLGQLMKPGITIYGLYNPREGSPFAWWPQYTQDAMPYQWQTPVNETWFGWESVAPVNEFTVMQGISNTALLWGYLAGTDSNLTPAPKALNGTSGKNDLKGSGANDFIKALEGDDTVEARAGDDVVYLGSGNDSGKGMDGRDMLFGESGNDSLDGGNESDLLYGGIGKDKLYGNMGDDVLKGDQDADILRGGKGADSLQGGYGADLYRYHAASEGRDSITYFSALDNFQFLRSAFGNLTGDTVSSANFLSRASGNQATTSNHRFIFDQSTDTLWYDSNGKADGGLSMIADMKNDVALTNLDLLLF